MSALPNVCFSKEKKSIHPSFLILLSLILLSRAASILEVLEIFFEPSDESR